MEGGFISNLHLKDITFDDNGNDVISSLTDSNNELSVFRLKRSKESKDKKQEQ